MPLNSVLYIFVKIVFHLLLLTLFQRELYTDYLCLVPIIIKCLVLLIIIICVYLLLQRELYENC